MIQRQEKSKSEVKYFPALSDLLLLTIKRQQTNLSRTLSDFFYTAFRKARDKFTDGPVIYPDIYYETVHKAIEELAILKEKRNYLLEHRTSGGIWLLGELQEKEISENTYGALWRNLLLAIRYQQDDLIVNHWETCHQYYNYSLPHIYSEYDHSTGSHQVSNQDAVNKRNSERQRFMEFHYVLGGLLLYKARYDCIKRLFSHTQSEPPRYELLPETMHQIFQFYFDVRDPYDRKYTWISRQYPFPEQSGLNADYVIKKWIMSYMGILFLRQYTIAPYLVTMRPLEFPPIPGTQEQIKQWIDGMDFFKKLVNDHLQNAELLKTLSLDFISPEWCAENGKVYPITFIEIFKANLENAYHANALNLPLSKTKIAEFENSTKTIIESTVDKLSRVNNMTHISNENSDKWYVNGQRMLQSKDAFSEMPEVHHLDFDSFLASVVSGRLLEGFAETFFYKKTKSFLLRPEDLFKAIDRLAIDGTFVIVNFGVNLDYYINHLRIPNLSHNAYNKTPIFSFNGFQIVGKSFFILRKSDLPNISTRPIEESEITKYSLKKISKSLNLHTSVIDLNNTSIELYNETKQDKIEDEVRKSVLLSIIILTEFKWKRNIEVIQLSQHSQFLQKGISHKLEDVKPIGKDPDWHKYKVRV